MDTFLGWHSYKLDPNILLYINFNHLRIKICIYICDELFFTGLMSMRDPMRS